MSNPAEEYKLAFEDEIKRWHGFWSALRKNDREAFEAMMDAGRSFVEAGSRAPECPIFEPMAFSILATLGKRITQLDEDLKPLRPPQSPPPEKPPVAEPQKPAVIYFKKKKPGGEQKQLW